MSHTDPLNPDSDGDGMPDGWEINYSHSGQISPLNPDDASLDPDGDHLSNYLEYNLPHNPEGHTDPLRWDSDGDGMPDGWEVAKQKWAYNPIEHRWMWLPDPLVKDGEMDYDEDGHDANHDGIISGSENYTNLEEYLYGYDMDGDGYNELTTDPLNPDTDGDGVKDGKEIWFGDRDGDGMLNGWEETYGLNPFVNDASDDMDGDGYTNLQEYKNGTNPNDNSSHP